MSLKKHASVAFGKEWGEGDQCSPQRHLLQALCLSGLWVKNKQVGSEDQMLMSSAGSGTGVGWGALFKLRD